MSIYAYRNSCVERVHLSLVFFPDTDSEIKNDQEWKFSNCTVDLKGGQLIWHWEEGVKKVKGKARTSWQHVGTQGAAYAIFRTYRWWKQVPLLSSGVSPLPAWLQSHQVGYTGQYSTPLPLPLNCNQYVCMYSMPDILLKYTESERILYMNFICEGRRLVTNARSHGPKAVHCLTQ